MRSFDSPAAGRRGVRGRARQIVPCDDSVRAEAIRSHVEFLASDLLEGRATASRGYDIAAAYVAAQFRQAGLQPAGDDNTFLQTVPLLEATPVLPGSSAELVRDDDTYDFEYGTHYLPSADFSLGQLDAERAAGVRRLRRRRARARATTTSRTSTSKAASP